MNIDVVVPTDYPMYGNACIQAMQSTWRLTDTGKLGTKKERRDSTPVLAADNPVLFLSYYSHEMLAEIQKRCKRKIKERSLFVVGIPRSRLVQGARILRNTGPFLMMLLKQSYLDKKAGLRGEDFL